MGVCGKNVENMQKLHTKLSQVIPKMWITLCKPISLHKYVTEEPDEKKVEK